MRLSLVRSTVLAATVCAALASAPAALAADGDLDPTFGGDGSAWLTVPGQQPYSGAPVLAAGPNGTVYVTAIVRPVGEGGSRSLVVARLTSAGLPDASYNGGAPVTVVSNSDFPLSGVLDAGADADGTLTVAAVGSSSVVAYRFTPSGALDGGYRDEGTSIIGAGTCNNPVDAAVRSDGSIVVAWGFCGLATRRSLRVVAAGAQSQLTLVGATGAPDESFAGDGSADITGAQGGIAYVRAIDVDAAGRTVTASSALPEDLKDPLSLSVSRFGVTGAADPVFKAAASALSPVQAPNDIAVSADGQRVGVALDSLQIPRRNAASPWSLAQYDGTGAPLAGFGTGGLAAIADARLNSAGPEHLLALGDGRLVALGESDDEAGSPAVLRTTATGALDPTFGTGGVTQPGFGTRRVILASPLLMADNTVLLGSYALSATGGRRAVLRTPVPTGSAIGATRLKGTAPATGQPPADQPATPSTPVTGAGSTPLPTVAPRSCGSRRVFTIHLRTGLSAAQKQRLKVASARVLVDGVAAKVVKTHPAHATVDLRRKPFGVSTVKITLRLSDGRRLKETRVYRTCRDGWSDRPAPPSTYRRH
jgi:uncharacterized delta-60 repeat protein